MSNFNSIAFGVLWTYLYFVNSLLFGIFRQELFSSLFFIWIGSNIFSDIRKVFYTEATSFLEMYWAFKDVPELVLIILESVEYSIHIAERFQNILKYFNKIFYIYKIFCNTSNSIYSTQKCSKTLLKHSTAFMEKYVWNILKCF